MIATYGNLDQIIPPNGHYNYMQRLFDEMGGVAATQDFYRYYVFPNATHCGGAGMTESLLFDALTNWVENGVKPDHLVAQVNPTRTRKVCMYPEHAALHRQRQHRRRGQLRLPDERQDDPALLRQEAGLLQGNGPLRNDHDIHILQLQRRGGGPFNAQD